MRCAGLPPFVFPVQGRPVQGKDEESPSCADRPVGTPQAEPRRAVQQREVPGQGTGKDGKQDPCGVCPGSPPALQAQARWFPIAEDTTCARIW